MRVGKGKTMEQFESRNNILTQVYEGMDVYDREGKKVGKVEYIQIGDENPASPGTDTVTANDPNNFMEGTFLEDVAEAFEGENEIPDTIRDRMIRQGFIRIDTGMLSADRYALSEHVSSVAEDRVNLRVSNDELIRF